MRHLLIWWGISALGWLIAGMAGVAKSERDNRTLEAERLQRGRKKPPVG